MKRFLMVAAATAALSGATAFADIENTFYIKAEAGAEFLNRVKVDGIKAKAKAVPFFGAGVGYYVMENFRTDLTFNYFNNPTFKKTVDKDNSIKAKTDISNLMINGYVEAFDVSVVKVFAGAGGGISQVKGKVSGKYEGTDFSKSVKKVNNFAYALILGAAADLADGVKGEVAYSWRDHGKTGKKVKGGGEVRRIALRGHHVSAGIRFDI